MYVLGLNTGVHDSSAALLRDGVLVHLVEQERLSRTKHAVFESPADAARACLAAAGITMASVDVIAIGWDVKLTRHADSRRFTREGLRQWLFPEVVPRDMPPIRWIGHHLAHAASTYYASGVDQAAVLVVDGAGEYQSTSIFRGSGGKLELLREWPIDRSLGFYYGLAGQWVGLDLHFGAGKLMGLAAYGRKLPGLSLCGCDGGYDIAVGSEPDQRPAAIFEVPSALAAAARTEFARLYPYVPRDREDVISYADFAATVQEALNDALLGLVTEARRLTGVDTLAIAGGVAMNCSAIGRLVGAGVFDHVYVPPVPTDAGVSLGAALVVAAEQSDFTPTLIDHAYWSDRITPESARAAVAGHGLAVRELPESEIAAVVAGAIERGHIVGWARGRAEIGQRALGARSIVADPRRRDSLARLNLLKGREMWRPVAPSVLAEYAEEMFIGGVAQPARFMLCAARVRPQTRTTMPAVTHVDGTARPQAVSRRTNPEYWGMIDRFRRSTGVPAVVNTSFNLADEPIVHTAADALATFLRAGLDLLVVGDLVVARGESVWSEQPLEDPAA